LPNDEYSPERKNRGPKEDNNRVAKIHQGCRGKVDIQAEVQANQTITKIGNTLPPQVDEKSHLAYLPDH